MPNPSNVIFVKQCKIKRISCSMELITTTSNLQLYISSKSCNPHCPPPGSPKISLLASHPNLYGTFSKAKVADS